MAAGDGKRGCGPVVCILLAVVVFAVYFQVNSHEFINFDDNIYVYENQEVKSGLNPNSIQWAFTTVKAGNWHPVTWLSHLLDVQLFDLNPGAHHLTNVFIHLSATLLLFAFLFLLTDAVWPSAFVAAIFGLHPQHVESVAWVSERKDVLSAFFGFLSLLLYVKHVKQSECVKQRQTIMDGRYYVLFVLSFVLGLMSKAMLVTIPVLLLLIDYWVLLQRNQELAGFPLLRSIKTKIPLCILSVIASIIAIYAQNTGGAITAIGTMPLWPRVENALVSYNRYIFKALVPRDLAIMYPLQLDFQLWQIVGSLIILLVISWAVTRYRSKLPYLFVGWVWFVVTLVPVIGLVQIGVQSMADRYSYIPMVGLSIMAAWGFRDLARWLKVPVAVMPVLAALILVAYAAVTWQQLGYWRDNVSLYRHTLAVTTNNAVIHLNLGSAFFVKGSVDEAIDEFREAVRINPGDAGAHYNLGYAYYGKRDYATAVREFLLTEKINPNFTNLHFNLAWALYYSGDVGSAIRQINIVIQMNPDDREARDLLEKWSQGVPRP